MNTPRPGHKFEAATEAGEPVGSTVGGPDWEEIEHAVECPLCRYNLRGLSEARCPECGYTFEWPEILFIARCQHPYLFEHHPDQNNWSFFRTLIGGLNPWLFWKTLHPVQPVKERRLTAYRWIAKGFASLPLVVSGLWLLMMSMSWPVNDWPRQSLFYLIDVFPGNATLLSELMRPFLHARLYIFILLMTLFLLALPEMSTLALLIYRASMRQAKIEKHHVDRCVAYSYDVVVWLVFGMLALGTWVLFLPITSWQAEWLSWSLVLLLPGAWLLMTVKLAFAYRYYLRIRHGVVAVAAGQVIVALVTLLVLMVMKELVVAV
jgi:rubredoxin